MLILEACRKNAQEKTMMQNVQRCQPVAEIAYPVFKAEIKTSEKFY